MEAITLVVYSYTDPYKGWGRGDTRFYLEVPVSVAKDSGGLAWVIPAQIEKAITETIGGHRWQSIKLVENVEREGKWRFWPYKMDEDSELYHRLRAEGWEPIGMGIGLRVGPIPGAPKIHKW